MTIKFDQEELKTLRKKLKPFNLLKLNSAILPIVSNVQVTIVEGLVTFYVSNLANTIEYSIRPRVAPKEAGGFLIDFPALWKFIYNAEEEMTIVYSQKPKERCGIVKMKAGEFILEITSDPLDEYMKRPDLGDREYAYCAGDSFIKCLKEAIMWVSHDDLRPAMTGVFFGNYNKKPTLVATDAHCLYHKHVTVSDQEKGQKLIDSILEEQFCRVAIETMTDTFIISAYEHHHVMKSGDYEIVGRKVDSRYPDFGVVMTNPENVFYLKRKQFRAFVKIARNFVHVSTKQVVFDVDGVSLKANGGDVDWAINFSYSVPVYQATEGAKTRFAVSIVFLERALNMGSDELVKVRHESSPTKAFWVDEVMMMPLMMNQ